MSTNIEWTDVTDNIIAVKGGGWWCQKISPGCANCYAAKLNQNAFYGGNKLAYSGPVPDLFLRTEIIDSWQRQRIAKKHFVASMTDVFGDWVPQEWINRMLVGMLLAPKQTFQVLTKRPDVALAKIKAFLELAGAKTLPPNVWIGTSVENQECADKRIPFLLEIPAAVRFLSCEPLLGPVDITKYFPRHPDRRKGTEWDYFGVNWVIVGGESGTKARPMHPDWARSLRNQCQDVEVPILFKQWGENVPCFMVEDETKFPSQLVEGTIMCRVGKKKAGRILDGREWNEFPTVEVAS